MRQGTEIVIFERTQAKKILRPAQPQKQLHKRFFSLTSKANAKPLHFKAIVLFLMSLPVLYLLAVWNHTTPLAVDAQKTEKAAVILTPTATPTPTPDPVGYPVSIQIPRLQVNTAVESIGFDGDNKIGVPSNFTNLAWFNQSSKPGELGNAFIDGHFDTYTGAPAVFYYLSSMSAGDTITVSDTLGKQYTFVVTEVGEYPIDSFPMDKIFTNHPTKKQLFLITCGGWWNAATHNYSHRTLVTAQLQSVIRPQ